MKIRYILAVLLTAVMILTACGCSKSDTGTSSSEQGSTESTESSESSEESEAAASPLSSDSKVGDIVTFGTYEQDNDTSNGAEAIEWNILDVQDGKALLVSRYALETMRYNEHEEAVRWETCTCRTWLNEDFFNTAFTSDEQNKIATVTVTDDANPIESTEPGNDTEDKVFLLSIKELQKYYNITDEDIKNSVDTEALAIKPTAYAVANGADVSEKTGTCEWLLRTPGHFGELVTAVFYSGCIYTGGGSVSNSRECIRPAMWVALG